MQHYNVPGLSLVIINEGEVEWAATYGVAALGGDDPVTADTLFQAASMSKPVAALAALRLVERGRLSLDDDVNAFLTGWKVADSKFTRARPVTLRRLLSHTAGFPAVGFWGYPPDAELPTLLNILNGEPPSPYPAACVTVEPGTGFAYSGPGYCVVQQLCQDASGRPFSDLVGEQVFEPLGMSHSCFEQPLSPAKRAGAAQAHKGDGSPYTGGCRVYPELAAAGMWTTPEDLAQIVLGTQRAYHAVPGSLLAPATAREMLSYQWRHPPVPGLTRANPMLSDGVGLGWGLSQGAGGSYFSHGGAVAGFQGIMLGRLDRGQGAVCMSNGDLGMLLGSELLMSVAKVYGWPDCEPLVYSLAELDPGLLEAYAGEYQGPSGRVIRLVPYDGRLRVEGLDLFGPFQLELYPRSETDFFCLLFPYDFRFARDAAGSVTHLIELKDWIEPYRRR
jgi:CubicO group peptidase (beta-lactamase class C family)